MKMKKHTPLVSVIMPVYNAGRYLADAIDSIVTQTYSNFEFIIVDDCSTDNSWNIIQSYRKKYPKLITSIRLKKNLNRGGDSCANVGFRKAKGQFIARMDADDIAHPKRLERQVRYLNTHPGVILVGSQAYIIDGNGKILGTKQVPCMHPEIYDQYFAVHPMIHPTIMIRRSLIPANKDLYQIKYSANNDYYTFFQLLRSGTFANMKDKLLYYRVHETNDSLTHLKNRFFNTIKIRLEAVFRFGYRPSALGVAKALAQSAVVLLLPERVLYSIYFYARGIKTFSPTDTIRQLVTSVSGTMTDTAESVYLKVWRNRLAPLFTAS